MVKYIFSSENSTSQYIKIRVEIPTCENQTNIHLPSWRPGRYELGNFSKNIKDFKVLDKDRKKIVFEKISKDEWVVDTSSTEIIYVEYMFYANEMTAGSSFLTDEQMYVNPVNCAVYTEETKDQEVQLKLVIPEGWIVATSMKKVDENYVVQNYDELADSPFICSPTLQVRSYEVKGVQFNVWFNGIVKPNWDRLLNDYKSFTEKQLQKFLEFPTDEFHFLNQIVPYKAYHGVEHQKSTVIVLGPSYDVFGELYKELLGVSSHELYHVWNVKSIRPTEMFPYDYKRENYSKLGYLYEGVTTYMGDVLLYKSGVFTLDQFLVEFTNQFQRHFDNHGRFNYSVAESSFDTWLDGYLVGAPARKVSIYTEGCLLAFVIDTMILRGTDNQHGLDTVMKRLYFDFYLKGKGVSEQNLIDVLENVSGVSFDLFFKDYVNGNRPYESILMDALEYVGIDLEHSPSKFYSQGRLGMKLFPFRSNFVVKTLYPGGPAELGGIMLEDEIISVNNVLLNGEIEKWLEYFNDELKTFTVKRNGKVLELRIPEVDRNFYMTYSLKQTQKLTNQQQKAFEAWKR